MYCEKCGKHFDTDSGICPDCGGPLKKNRHNGCLTFIVAAVLVFALVFTVLAVIPEDFGKKRASRLVIPDAREYFTDVSECETATVMVYVIGSELEADGGSASADIREMLKAELGENVRVLLQAGGTEVWDDPQLPSGCTRFEIIDSGLSEVSKLGAVCMTDQNTVSDFMDWAAAYAPADRYELILWDHCGGITTGFGCDENFPGESLKLFELSEALSSAPVKFDMIGIDAGLSGTIEAAYAMEKYADFLVASEDSEPADGWYYTGWLNALARNPSIDTATLGKKIVDDYLNQTDASEYDAATLSVTELRYIPYTYRTLCAFMKNAAACLPDGYAEASESRFKARTFGPSSAEQTDIIDWVRKTDIAGSEELIAAIENAVRYCGGNVNGASGLAMYFPYNNPELYEETVNELYRIDYGHACTEFFTKLLNIMSDGQTEIKKSPFGDNVRADLSGCTWRKAGETNVESKVRSHMLFKENDKFTIKISDEEWSEVTDARMWISLDDGEGYFVFGSEDIYTLYEGGSLAARFDGEWVSLNGEPVPFYAESEEEYDNGRWYTRGYTPALLNGEENIDIIIYWDSDREKGYVAGYRGADDPESLTAKGCRRLHRGDTINITGEYYYYDGTYAGRRGLGRAIRYSVPLTVSSEAADTENIRLCFMLRDVYNNTVFTGNTRME